VSKPLLTVSTADILVFTLERLYTLTTTRVSLDARVCKALKHFQDELTYALGTPEHTGRV
jgi:hypothetical protein